MNLSEQQKIKNIGTVPLLDGQISIVRIRKRPTNSQTNCTSPSIEVLTNQHLIEGADTGLLC